MPEDLALNLDLIIGIRLEHSKAPFTPSASARVDASNQTNVKDRKHSHRPRRVVDARQLICIHRMSDVSLSYA